MRREDDVDGLGTRGRSLILLEDLAPAKTGDQVNGLSAPQVRMSAPSPATTADAPARIVVGTKQPPQAQTNSMFFLERCAVVLCWWRRLGAVQAHDAVRQIAKLHATYWHTARKSGVQIMAFDAWSVRNPRTHISLHARASAPGPCFRGGAVAPPACRLCCPGRHGLHRCQSC